ncbi:lipoprotein [Salmonella enterica subsp. enterica serovar Pullorum]|nr:lipoprotein [Salmonella enterica subsp. enterica serovar Pullorum]
MVHFLMFLLHDDRYLYFFGDTLVDSGQRRNVTRTLDTAHIDKSGYYLVTEEGKYEVINNAFTSR